MAASADAEAGKTPLPQRAACVSIENRLIEVLTPEYGADTRRKVLEWLALDPCSSATNAGVIPAVVLHAQQQWKDASSAARAAEEAVKVEEREEAGMLALDAFRRDIKMLNHMLVPVRAVSEAWIKEEGVWQRARELSNMGILSMEDVLVLAMGAPKLPERGAIMARAEARIKQHHMRVWPSVVAAARRLHGAAGVDARLVSAAFNPESCCIMDMEWRTPLADCSPDAVAAQIAAEADGEPTIPLQSLAERLAASRQEAAHAREAADMALSAGAAMASQLEAIRLELLDTARMARSAQLRANLAETAARPVLGSQPASNAAKPQPTDDEAVAAAVAADAFEAELRAHGVPADVIGSDTIMRHVEGLARQGKGGASTGSGDDGDDLDAESCSAGDAGSAADVGAGFRGAAFGSTAPAAAAASADVCRWDVGSVITREIAGSCAQHVMSLSMSHSSDVVISGSSTGIVSQWNVETGEEVLSSRLHKQPVRTLVASNDGRAVITGSDDRTVKLWDLRSGAAVRTFKGVRRFVSSLAHSSSHPSQLVAVCSSAGVIVWDLGSAKRLSSPRIEAQASAVAISVDGTQLAAGMRASAGVCTWHRNNPGAGFGESIIRPGTVGMVHGIAIARDNSVVWAHCYDGPILRASLSSTRAMEALGGAPCFARSLAVAWDSSQCFAATREGKVVALDAATGALLRTVETPNADGQSIAVGHSARVLAVGGSGAQSITLLSLKPA